MSARPACFIVADALFNMRPTYAATVLCFLAFLLLAGAVFVRDSHVSSTRSGELMMAYGSDARVVALNRELKYTGLSALAGMYNPVCGGEDFLLVSYRTPAEYSRFNVSYQFNLVAEFGGDGRLGCVRTESDNVAAVGMDFVGNLTSGLRQAVSTFEAEPRVAEFAERLRPVSGSLGSTYEMRSDGESIGYSRYYKWVSKYSVPAGIGWVHYPEIGMVLAQLSGGGFKDRFYCCDLGNVSRIEGAAEWGVWDSFTLSTMCSGKGNAGDYETDIRVRLWQNGTIRDVRIVPNYNGFQGCWGVE